MTPHDTGPNTLGEGIARVDRETADLVRSVGQMTVGDLAEPSRCPGWTRAHVIAHLARNADSLVNLVRWALTGEPTPQYLSAQARDEDIERTAAQSLQQLRMDLQDSAQRCRDALRQLAGDLKTPDVTLRSGRVISAHDLPLHRVNELVIHHFDLRTQWTLSDASPQSLLGGLRDYVARLNTDPATPSFVLRPHEGDEFVVGPPLSESQQPVTVRGSRAGLLAWLARGITAHVHAEVELPVLPSWG